MNKRYKSLLNVLKEFDLDTEEYRQMALVLAEKLDKQEFTSLFSFFLGLNFGNSHIAPNYKHWLKKTLHPKSTGEGQESMT